MTTVDTKVAIDPRNTWEEDNRLGFKWLAGLVGCTPSYIGSKARKEGWKKKLPLEKLVKECHACEKILDTNCFGPCAATFDGYQTKCRSCRSIEAKNSYLLAKTNKETTSTQTQQEGANMITKEKVNAVMANSSSMVKKVYLSVPISVAWTTNQITSDVIRSGKRSQTNQETTAALKALTASGLVTEFSQGKYAKVKVNDERGYPVILGKPPERKDNPSDLESLMVLLETASNESAKIVESCNKQITEAEESKYQAQLTKNTLDRAIKELAKVSQEDHVSTSEYQEKIAELQEKNAELEAKLAKFNDLQSLLKGLAVAA